MSGTELEKLLLDDTGALNATYADTLSQSVAAAVTKGNQETDAICVPAIERQSELTVALVLSPMPQKHQRPQQLPILKPLPRFSSITQDQHLTRRSWIWVISQTILDFMETTISEQISTTDRMTWAWYSQMIHVYLAEAAMCKREQLLTLTRIF